MKIQLYHRVSRDRLITTLIIGSILLAASIVVAWDGGVPGWEASLLNFFNDWPDWLLPPFWFVQQAGNLFAPVVGGLIVFAITRNWWHLTAFVAVLPLKLGLEKALIKQLVERERPFVSLGPEVNVRGPAFEGLSFPSGHSTTAFAFGVLLTAFLPPKWRPLPLAWAAMTGIIRLYYGEHNVMDVVGGAALGTMFATGLWFILLNPRVNNNGMCPQ